jgi:hypothetical protein
MRNLRGLAGQIEPFNARRMARSPLRKRSGDTRWVRDGGGVGQHLCQRLLEADYIKLQLGPRRSGGCDCPDVFAAFETLDS